MSAPLPRSNHRVDMELDCSHIQESVHFHLMVAAAFAEHPGRLSGESETSLQPPLLFKCHMGGGTVGLAVVVAALLNSLHRLHLSCFV